MKLQCNVVSHWLGSYTKWSLHPTPSQQPVPPPLATVRCDTTKSTELASHLGVHLFFISSMAISEWARTTWTTLEWTNFTNPRMHLFHIPECSIQSRNVHISVLNGAFWDMEQVHSGISELGQIVAWWCILDNTGSDNGQSPVRHNPLPEPMLTHCQLDP